MRHCCRHHCRALSIPDILIGMLLFGLVTTATAFIMREGIRFYNTNTAALEVQQQTVRAMDQLGTELAEASISSFNVYRNPDGIIFSSTRNEDGETTQDPDTGEMQWHKYVCYYVEDAGSNLVLVRKEKMWDEPALDPPPIPADMKIQDFQTMSGGSPRIVARHIKSLVASASNPTLLTVKADYLDGRFTLKLQTSILMLNN